MKGLGRVLREEDVHHYGIDFDDHGSYDVICTGLETKIVDGNQLGDI
jgi:hypothetical protein